MKREALHWKKLKNNTVQCQLCAHQCTIGEGKRGLCGVRENTQGILSTCIYGSYSSMAVDPIEKKPLYHFHPGTRVFSLGTVGCNFQCLHCQNYTISRGTQETIPLQEATPQQIVTLAQTRGCSGIAWTYNEPTIWHEFALDTSKIAHQNGLYTVYVTNGYLTEGPLKELSSYLDAMNIDIKAFHEEFYKTICKARLAPVLETCKRAKNLGIHLELTYLVIPTYNDSLDEIISFCRWVVETLGADTPVHFSRFHPDYHLTDVPPTPRDTLTRIYETAKKEGILFPYLGNVPHGAYENTICPQCGATCIERYGFTAQMTGVSNGICNACGASIPLITTDERRKK